MMTAAAATRHAIIVAWDFPSVEDTKREQQQREPRAPVSIWCWHCCHPFETTPVPLPISYDDRRDIWKTQGTFCSFSCAKSYNVATMGYRSSIVAMLLMKLQRTMLTGDRRTAHILPAPPRRCLAVFGGTMSIDEFRAKAGQGIVVNELPPNVVPLETILAESKAAARRVRPRTAADNLETSIDFTDVVQAKNETLRLRRPKPMPSNTNVLARTMGLTLG